MIRTTAGLTFAAALTTADESSTAIGLAARGRRPRRSAAARPADRGRRCPGGRAPSRRRRGRPTGRGGDDRADAGATAAAARARPAAGGRRLGSGSAAALGRGPGGALDGLRSGAGSTGSASSHAERAHSGRRSGVGEKATVSVSASDRCGRAPAIGAGSRRAASSVMLLARVRVPDSGSERGDGEVSATRLTNRGVAGGRGLRRAARPGTCVPAPSRLSTETVPPCISTMLRTIARPRPLPLPRASLAREPRKKRSKIRGSSAGVDADAGVRDGDRGAAVGLAADLDPDRAAARRELDRVADAGSPRPGRSGPGRAGSGSACPGRSIVSSTPRRRAVAAACSTACSTADRRSSGRRSSRTRPESSFESSSRFWASQSRRSSWARLVSRNSARAVGSSAAPSVSSSLNVRSAAIGVRSSCDTSARNSRLRSRSRRMISTLSWSRSAIALNWSPSSDSSIGPSSIASDGHAPREVALGEVAARLGEPAQRAS